MRSGCLALSVVGLVLALCACTHDYDKLREPKATGIRDGGDSGSGGSGGSGGGSGTGGSGSGGESGSGGSDPDGGSGIGGSGGGGSGGTGGAPPDACEPCAALSEQAMAAGLESCCRGLRNNTCGIAVSEDDDALCFARDVAGEPDATCLPVGPAGNRRDGCCRPDGRCGAEFTALGLGCVAREDIPDALAPRANAVACRLPCESDEGCAGVPDVDTVCVPDRDDADVRYCAPECQRDADCGGQVCALSPDLAQDRLIAFCQEPYGDRVADEVCQSANQCDHGVCLRPAGETEATCSLLCEVKADCPTSLPFCVASQIGRPSGMGDPIAFRVCSATAP